MLLRPALIALLAVCTGLQALPSILVDPDQFAFEMPHGTVENSVLNIANDGDEPLEVVVSLGVPRRDVTVNVVLWTRFATDQWRLGNLITGLSTIEADLRRIDFNDYTPDALEEVLSNAHVLVLPEQPGASQGFLFDLGRTWTDVLRDFLDRGGYIVGAESAGGIARLLEGAGLMSIRIASLAQQLNCTSNDHPITAGIPNFVALRTCNVHRAIGFESQQLTRIEGWGEEFTNISARRHGRGGIAYLGMNWWQYNDDMNFLLGNAVLWFQGGASWLLLERFAGTIRPDDSRDVFFTIDSRLTSEPGEYRRDILITSNDPANPRVTVPVDLTVTSWLPSELALTPEAFFVISRRDSAAVLIANNLGEGMLRAEVFLDDPNQQWLTINRNELVIPGGFEDRVLLRFSAANARTGFNANRLVIRYANPDTIETLVPITYYTGSTFGALEGRVTEALSGDPVTGVFISLDGLEAETDQNGDYRFPTVPVSNYQISLDARDYLPYRSGWLTIRENETASNDIALRWCSLEMTFDPDLQIASPGGHLTRIDGQFSNPGDGELRFNTEFREPAVPRNLNPWQTRLVLAPGSAVAATELYGVAFARERIYLSGLGPDQEPWLWRLDRNGALLDSIRQPGDHPRGMSDLAWDGELVWGADDGEILGLNASGEIVATVRTPIAYARALAWSGEDSTFYIADARSDIFQIDREGRLVARYENPGLRIYGLAWREWSDDGYPVFLFSQDGPSSAQVNRFDPLTGEFQFQRDLPTAGSEFAGGCELTFDWEARQWTMLLQFTGSEGRTAVHHIGYRSAWARLLPPEGEVRPGNTLPVAIEVDARGMREGSMARGIIIIDGHQRGGPDTLRVELTVTASKVEDDEELALPGSLRLRAYPSPFNSILQVEYAMKAGSKFDLRFYDLSGREIAKLNSGHGSGRLERATFDATGLASGTYVVKLASEGGALMRKVVLLK